MPARPHYGSGSQPVAGLDFEELADGDDRDELPWMSAAWAYAACVTAAFARHGWLARTRGLVGGGRVEGLPACTFPVPGFEARGPVECPTEIALDERRGRGQTSGRSSGQGEEAVPVGLPAA